MDSVTHFHFNHKICLVLLLFFAFLGCQPKYNVEVNELAREGNNLLDQSADISHEWNMEFIKVFTPENRAKFPSNREMLRPPAENQIRLLEHQEVLENSAADKFEQANRISNNEKEKRFTLLTAISIRKGVEISQLFKEMMKLVLDDNIKDLKTLETTWMDLTQRIEMKMKERDDLETERKRILGR